MTDFILRPFREADADSIALNANNKKVADNLRDVFPFPYALEDAKNYIAMCIREDGKDALLRAVEIGGKAVGNISVFVQKDVYRKNAELGYWLGETYWRKGIMHRAVKEICAEAFSTFDILRIYAESYSHNLGSRGVLEKAGFVLEGEFRDNIIKNGVVGSSRVYALYR